MSLLTYLTAAVWLCHSSPNAVQFPAFSSRVATLLFLFVQLQCSAGWSLSLCPHEQWDDFICVWSSWCVVCVMWRVHCARLCQQSRLAWRRASRSATGWDWPSASSTSSRRARRRYVEATSWSGSRWQTSAAAVLDSAHVRRISSLATRWPVVHGAVSRSTGPALFTSGANSSADDFVVGSNAVERHSVLTYLLTRLSDHESTRRPDLWGTGTVTRTESPTAATRD